MEMPEEVKQQRKLAGGRPTKLTPEVQEVIVSAIRAGNYIETAAALAGISKDALYDWLKKGNDPYGFAKARIYREFADAVKKAVAESEERDLAIIQRAAEGYEVVRKRATTRRNEETGKLEVVEQSVEQSRDFSWTAAAWRLERKFPDRWARRDHVQVSGDKEAPLIVQQQADPYSGRNLSELMLAFFDAKLIPAEIMQAISFNLAVDVTPGNGNGNGNGTNGNGSGPNGKAD